MANALDRELLAVEALLKLFADARECERLHVAADLPLPAPLLRLLYPELTRRPNLAAEPAKVEP